MHFCTAIIKNLCATVHFLHINKLFNKIIELLLKGYHNLTITFFAKKNKIYNLFSIRLFKTADAKMYFYTAESVAVCYANC